MASHILKTAEPYWTDVFEGRKHFEVRWNDRDFKVGDMLELVNRAGKTCWRKVIYVLEGGHFGIETGYVVLGIE